MTDVAERPPRSADQPDSLDALLPTVQVAPCSSKESLSLSVIEENDEHSRRSPFRNGHDDSSGSNENLPSPVVPRRREASLLIGAAEISVARPTPVRKFPFSHRLSVPNLAPFLAAHTKPPEVTKMVKKHQRKSSLNSVFFATENNDKNKDDEEKQPASVKCTNRKSNLVESNNVARPVSMFAAPNSLLDFPSRARIFSTSTPSVKDACDEKTSGRPPLKNDAHNTAPGELEAAAPTPVFLQKATTPRMPLRALLPTSMRRSSEKLIDFKAKPKDKERRSFFKSKTKSRELKEPHSWISNVSPLANLYCNVCNRRLLLSESCQCSGCHIGVHNLCKDQAGKVGCEKLVKTKINCDSSADSRSDSQTKENHEGNRRSVSTPNGELLSFTNRSYPNGFYAFTPPDPVWDLELDLWQDEPEAWSNSVGQLEKKRLTSKEIKRQDIIHELYVTEKHHCQILVVLKHTYYEAILHQKIFEPPEMEKLFPKVNSLLEVHRDFLLSLKRRKNEQVVVDAIHDVILQQFRGNAQRMTEAYTLFCAQKDLTDKAFQKLLQVNLSYQAFVKHLSLFPFYKSRSLRDCLLLVTQRLSKYHTFVESLRKNTPDNSCDKENILLAEKAVKEVVASIDRGIDRLQMQQFHLDLLRDMDPKTCAFFSNSTFTAQDMCASHRTLIYKAHVQWPNAKRIPADVLLLLFTDILVFLRRTGAGQYVFYSQDKKASIVPLVKMILRDKAGRLGIDGIYLIATQPKPEMYEVRCKTKKETTSLVGRIQMAINECPAPKVSELEEKPVIESGVANKNEIDQLEQMFDKLAPINDKLKSYCQDLLQSFEEITNFVDKLNRKFTNQADKEKMQSAVSKLAQEYLTSLNPASMIPQLAHQALKNDLLRKISEQDESTSSLERNNEDTPEPTGNVNLPTSSAESSTNAVSRSNTFHGRGRCCGRRSLRKYTTISGIPEVDVRVRAVITDVDVADASSSESLRFLNSPLANSDSSQKSLLDYVLNAQAEMNELKQNNAKLEIELMVLKRQTTCDETVPTAVISHHRQSSADSTQQTLEELRRLHTSLDAKRAELALSIQQREVTLKAREAALAEREASLARADDELRQRWDQLYKAWDQKRLNVGLPLAPLVSGPVNRSSTTSCSSACATLEPLRPVFETGEEQVEEPLTRRNVTQMLFSRFAPTDVGRSSLRGKKWHSTSKLARSPSTLTTHQQPPCASSPLMTSPPQQIIPSKLASSSIAATSGKKK